MTIQMTRTRTFLAAVALLAAYPVAAVRAQDEVVARVSGQDITEGELAIAEGLYGQQLEGMPADARRSMMVDALIEMRVLADAARAEGLSGDPEFQRQLAFLETQALRTLFLQRKISAAVTDAAVRAAYDRQLAAMPAISELRLRHILLATEADARAVIDALAQGGDFAALARERSLDTGSAEKGGDVGFFPQGQTLPELEAAVAGLAPGAYSPAPVKTAFGFHVVKLEEKRERPAPAFETIAAQIRQSLEAAEEQRLAAELKARAKVEKLVPDVEAPEGEDGHEH